jgi:hypothetical protein
MEKIFYYAYLASSALTVIVFLLGLVHFKVGQDYAQFQSKGRKAPGTITDLITRTERSNDGEDTRDEKSFYVTYEFRDSSGKIQSGEQLLNEETWDNFKKGQAVEVTYLPESPAKNAVSLETMEYGHRQYKNVFLRATLLFFLTISCFGINLFLAYQRVTKPVVIGHDWIKAPAEVKVINQSQELIDRLFLKRINLGFNVPLPPSVKSGELPWVERSIRKELASSIKEGDQVIVIYPTEDQTKAVLELEFQ